MLAKDYVKGKRNMHFLLQDLSLETGFTSLTPGLEGTAFLALSHVNKVICTPRRNSELITGVSADKKEKKERLICSSFT